MTVLTSMTSPACQVSSPPGVDTCLQCGSHFNPAGSDCQTRGYHVCPGCQIGLATGESVCPGSGLDF